MFTPLDIWDLKKPGRPYGDPFSALGGAWKSEKYPILRVLHTWWDPVESWCALKNELWLTFGTVESVLRVVWSYGLFQMIDMIIIKHRKVNGKWYGPLKNFLRPSKVQSSLQNATLFDYYGLIKWSSNPKNGFSLTFGTIKFDLRPLRSFRLFLSIDMIMGNPANTNSTCIEALENFFESVKVALQLCWHSTFEALGVSLLAHEPENDH